MAEKGQDQLMDLVDSAPLEGGNGAGERPPLELNGSERIGHNGETLTETESGERLPGGLELVSIESRSEIDPYRTPEYLELVRSYNPPLLTYELRERFRGLPAVVFSADAEDFSKSTTRLAAEKGEKVAGEEIAMIMREADAKLMGIAKLYGGVMLSAEGDGRRMCFPVQPDENMAEVASRALFVASQFQEASKGLPPLRFKDGAEDVHFRIGVDCTDQETGDLIITSFGDDYLRGMAVFGAVIPRVDGIQHEADAKRHQVAVSPAVRRLLPRSQFRGTENGKAFILSSLHGDDKPEPVTIEMPEDKGVDIETLSRYYEAHIPKSQREGLKSAVITALEEGTQIKFDPPWEYPRVSTSFIKVLGLNQEVLKATSNGNGDGSKVHSEINQWMAEVLHTIERNGGAVERITGEGVIYAPFEGPSNEYHATRATFEAGRLINSAGFKFKAGVSTDFAFSAVAGAEGHQTFTQIGQRVNESARLMQTAPENQVVISGATHRRAAHRLRCRLDEPIELKGVGTVERYEVEKIDYRAGRYAEVEKVVGREQEQRQIEEWIRLAGETHQSQIVVVEGEAGVGKTAVVSKTIADNLEAGRIYKIDVRSDEADRKLPLSTARQLVRQIMHIPEEIESPRDLEARIVAQGMTPEVMERLALLNGILGTNFTMGEKMRWLVQDDRSEQRQQTIKLIKDLFVINHPPAASEVPVICVDDWQFIDRQSADLVIDLIRETQEDGVVWVVPTRPPAPNNDIEKAIIAGIKNTLPERTHQLDIEPFPAFVPPEFPGEKASDAEMRNYYLKLRNGQIAWMQQNKEWVVPLVCAVFDIDPSEFDRNPQAAAKVVASVFSKDVSHGNIFYVQEFLSHLAMSQDLKVKMRDGSEQIIKIFVQHPETGKWHFGDYQLPGETEEMVKNIRTYYLADDQQREIWKQIGTIVDLEKRKISAHSSNAQTVARVMSILGLESSRKMLLRITRMPERRLDMSLDELIDHGTALDLDGGRFGFVHRITQETIYGSIANEAERHSIHEMVLGILEEEYPNEGTKLESKYFHAKNSGNSLKILKYSDLYGRQLRSYGEESGAISVLERGWQEFDKLEKSAFPGLDAAQRRQVVNEQLERMLCVRFIWNRLAKRDEEVTTLELAHELFHRHYGGEDGQEQYPAEWAAYHAWILSDLGLRVGDKKPKRAAREYYEVALNILKPFEKQSALDGLSDKLRQTIITNLSNVYRRLGIYHRKMAGVDNFNKARILAEHSVQYARLVGDYETVTSAVNGLGIVLTNLGELDLANKCYNECLRLAEQTGNLPDQAVYLGNQAEVLRGLGDAVGAEAAAMRSLEITDRVFRPRTKAWSNVGLGSLRMALGDFVAAARYFTEAKRFFDDADVLMSSAIGLDLAQCHLRNSQPDTVAARTELSSIRSEDKRLNMVSVYITAYADYLDGYIGLDDFIAQAETQAVAMLADKMTQSAMDAYRFLGEVMISYDRGRAKQLLESALNYSRACHAGVDEKMIEAELQSLGSSQVVVR